MFRLDHDIDGLVASLDGITEAAEESVRPSAQAGAQVFYESVRLFVRVGSKPHATRGGKHKFSPGNLRSAIYQAFSPEESTKASGGDGYAEATYHISWNKEKAFYGSFLERGTAHMSKKPFLRPGHDAARDRALEAARDTMVEGVEQRLANLGARK